MSWSFLSAPDLFNRDFADLSAGADPAIAAVFGPGYGSTLTRASGWTAGGPNSMTPALAQVWLTNLQSMVASAGGNPKVFLAAGDLVYARWPQNSDTLLAMFGDGSGDVDVALNAAADVYYGWYRELFKQSGIDTLLATVGDHDIGDNNWAVGSAKANSVNTMKEAFGRNMVDTLGLAPRWSGVSARAPEGSGQYDEGSYVQQVNNVLFLTVDVFRYVSAETELNARLGVVDAAVTGAHLAWVQKILDAAETNQSVDHVVIQGHVPVLGPVNSKHSSEIMMTGGKGSEFWSTIQGYGTNNGGKVRMYLAGEVHATTTTEDMNSGIVQIAHGRPGYVSPTYIAFEVTTTSITGIEYQIPNANTIPGKDIWQVDEPGGLQSMDAVTGVPEVTGHLIVDVAAGTTNLSVTGTFDGWKGDATGIMTYVGGSADDSFTANERDNRLFGLDGDDTLDGADGNDTLVGSAGDDNLYGGNDNDTLVGGGGADYLDGGNGTDMVGYSFSGSAVKVNLSTGLGGAAAWGDTLTGIEEVIGSRFGDTITGIDGIDVVLGGHDGGDRLTGRNGYDTLVGGKGNDTLYGGGHGDALHGGSGHDQMKGGWGWDTLIGGTGRDTLTGGTGRDIMTGGGWADTFDFNSVGESAVGATRDRILDFLHNIDKIDLSDIDAITGGGDNAFTFLGSGALAGAGDLRFFTSGPNTIIEGDVDGGGADFQIQLDGLINLTAGDFLL